MAPPGKFRSKRASSSYSSTLTTVGFIALCVFGVWMLTSDSIVPPDTSAGVIIEDPATARLVDKAADLPIKSTEEESNFNDSSQKEEENKPEEKKEAETLPEIQSKQETGGGGDNNAAVSQENTEARAGDEEGAKPQNGETNGAATESVTGAESKEDIPQAGNQNEDRVEKSDQTDQNNQNQNPFEQNDQIQNQVEKKNQNQNQLEQNQEKNLQNDKDQIEQMNPEEQRSRDQDQSSRIEDLVEQRSRDQDHSNRIEDQVEQRSRDQDQSNRIDDQVEQRNRDQDQSNRIDDQVEQRNRDQYQSNRNDDQVEQRRGDQYHSNRNEDQVEERSRDQDQSNRNDDQGIEQRSRDQDQINRIEDQVVEQRSRDVDQSNPIEDEVEQRTQRQVTIPTKESGERREKPSWNRNDQMADPEHQRQQEQKREAEQQQQLRDQAEQQLKLPEEGNANQKVEESEAQMAREEQQKQQAERHNMMSEEDQQNPVQQHKSDHKLDGHEFSDQTNNQDTKSDSDQDDDAKSHLPDKQQPDNQSRSNAIDEAKQATTTNSFPGGESSGIPQEAKESKAWSTQAVQSENQNERHATKGREGMYGYTWQLCNETSGADFIPCLDNEKALRRLRTTRHFEHRERHCPEDPPTCLVPLPEGYKTPITWPSSKDRIWYHNVPHTSLAEFKGHQNWVKVTGEFLTFPGGGTQFINGANYYLDFIQQAVPDISWGKHIRVTLDVGCGVASFGGYLFDRDVLTMSFAPKDEHEAQVQFALERGIPAISAVMGTQRLPFPSRVFDLVHCARCRVPWHEEGGRLLMELNRVLRPGGYFVWSATPVYQKIGEDLEIWNEMSALTKSMCLELVTIKRNKINKIAAAIYRKPRTNECYQRRRHKNPPMCKNDDDASAAWYVPLQSCIHEVPVDPTERGARWPEEWPERLQTPPYWLNSSQIGIYGKPAPEDFSRDYLHWKMVVERSYLKGLGIDWTNVRNVMDMRSVYGGFAAALKDLKVWVLNVVNTDSPDTLPIIYERGLFGIYHDWCESFSSYPRSYDLLHADHLFSRLKKRCKTPPLMVEIDRLLRPGGKLIVRDESSVIGEVENLLRSLRWEVRFIFSKSPEGLLSAQKTNWRPDTYVASA